LLGGNLNPIDEGKTVTHGCGKGQFNGDGKANAMARYVFARDGWWGRWHFDAALEYVIWIYPLLLSRCGV